MLPTEEWLRTTNQQFRKADIHPRLRPFRAIEEYSKQLRCAVAIPSQTADVIFDWFKKNTPEGSQILGALFRGVYYFDSVFWPVYIPIGYGKFQLNAFSSIETMPDNFRKQIEADRMELWNYVLLWVDCLDYAYGYDDLLKDSRLSNLAGTFMKSGNNELTAAVSMLIQQHPEPKAIESCRMVVEMFLKSIIIKETNWNEKQVKKKIGHDLIKAVNEALILTGNADLEKLKGEYSSFPEIHERYSGKARSPIELWRGYAVAQATATIFTRTYSDRDTRSQIMNKEP